MLNGTICRRMIIVPGILAILLLLPGQRAMAEINTLFNVNYVLPGMTQSIDIGQINSFPACPQFFIFVLGKGTLGISLKKDDYPGDSIFMLGSANSSAGTVPIYRLGTSKGMIDQIIEIGDDDAPYGFVWVYCGVAYSALSPKYFYQLRVSLEP